METGIKLKFMYVMLILLLMFTLKVDVFAKECHYSYVDSSDKIYSASFAVDDDGNLKYSLNENGKETPIMNWNTENEEYGAILWGQYYWELENTCPNFLVSTKDKLFVATEDDKQALLNKLSSLRMNYLVMNRYIDANSESKVSCGNVTGIPRKIPELTSDAVTILEVAVPIILIIFGSIDLLKGVVAQKEDEIKKGKSILIKRLITAAVIFFIVVVVKLLVSVVSDATNSDNIIECIDCFISGVENCKL